MQEGNKSSNSLLIHPIGHILIHTLVFWLTVPYAVAEKRLIKVHFLFAKVRNPAPPAMSLALNVLLILINHFRNISDE